MPFRTNEGRQNGYYGVYELDYNTSPSQYKFNALGKEISYLLF